ncbi:hypothetical protein VZT92_018155 [Zoarces viviparus]|uniref:Uncharacterized protein n=1 Tax=Zoarces viviparus TaxID=48416 RepID=A0AAW1EPK7_ZOAVI
MRSSVSVCPSVHMWGGGASKPPPLIGSGSSEFRVGFTSGTSKQRGNNASLNVEAPTEHHLKSPARQLMHAGILMHAGKPSRRRKKPTFSLLPGGFPMHSGNCSSSSGSWVCSVGVHHPGDVIKRYEFL